MAPLMRIDCLMANVELHLQKDQPPLLLLTSYGQQYEKQSIYCLLEYRYQTTCIPILENKRILGSAYGWLVVLGPDGDCCLWNPTEENIIHLPVLENPHLYGNCIMSKPPTDPDCHVLLSASYVEEQSACKIGDAEFAKVTADEESGYLLIAMASIQGVFYGVVLPNFSFVTIHLVRTTIKFRELLIDGKCPWKAPQPRPNWVRGTDNYLIESPCGGDHELLLVTKMYSVGCVEFGVFQVNFGRMTCQQIDKLDDGLTLFISFYGNRYCRSSSAMGSKSNSIYYTEDKGRVMYVYDLEDRSSTTLLPCPASARYLSINYWVDVLAASLFPQK